MHNVSSDAHPKIRRANFDARLAIAAEKRGLGKMETATDLVREAFINPFTMSIKPIGFMAVLAVTWAMNTYHVRVLTDGDVDGYERMSFNNDVDAIAYVHDLLRKRKHA